MKQYRAINPSLNLDPNNQWGALGLTISTCSKCREDEVAGLDKCSNCAGTRMDFGLEDDENKHIKPLCEEARSKKLEETPDEKIEGPIFKDNNSIRFVLTSIYNTFYVGTEEESVKDYSRWEKEIRSIKSII